MTHSHDHHHEGHACCSAHAAKSAQPAVTRDPVCGMTVDPAAGRPTAEHGGRTFHFCSQGCRTKFEAAPQDYLTATDPVCGMTVDRATARHFLKADGQKHYFCSESCLNKFQADPEKYRDGRPAPAPAPKGTKYTCPMHPEIVRDGPGDCPICGMALEPMGVPTGEEGPNPELIDFTRRFWVSAVLSIPLLVVAMGPMLGLPVRDWIGEPLAGWLELALATPVVLWAALPFFRRGWASVVNRSPNMWTLISLGVGAAYLYSVVAILFPDLFPHAMRGHGGAVPVYFEASAVIVALVFLGQVLELKAREKTGSAIRALLDLAPKTARRIGADGMPDIIGTAPARFIEPKRQHGSRCSGVVERRPKHRKRLLELPPRGIFVIDACGDPLLDGKRPPHKVTVVPVALPSPIGQNHAARAANRPRATVEQAESHGKTAVA